ncbi:hypothetical protein LNV23_12075 [Paucibacter sp. DJ1R-11]|uniref:hypothetical protein n=1 Tax=Paucibacter sp. DJ1R-11 TaxID=2893556 RepID=UPI0021E478DA|nr:hypothetical protein [Paucibacter sp. DJ1R-11]MCV2364181.1 hypothetical protein [Paucibacter sp. DJ1R-11]
MKSISFLTPMFAIAMTLATASVQAQTHLQRVDVSGQGVNDLQLPPLSMVCPAYAQTLQDQLSAVATREGSAATVRVSFKLGGDQPSDLRIQDGPLEYRKAVRRAMHQISCQTGVAQGGEYKLVLSFNAASPEITAASGMARQERVALAMR